MSVQFALPETAAPLKEQDGFIIRPGKYFEIGTTFTDKNGTQFGLTADEAAAAVDAFTPSPLNIEHSPSVLDNLLGRVDRLWIDGNDIMADYALPKWLHEATAGKEIKTSSEWDLATKRPGGAALVLNPAVKDAAIHAAFSAHPEAETRLNDAVNILFERHDTPSGQMALQDVHDATARAGAVCDKKNVQMAAKHEMTALQAMHDMTTEHGAVCASGKNPYSSMSMFSKPTEPSKGKTTMTAWEKFVAFCKGQGMSDADATELAASDPAKFSAASGMTETEKAQFAAQSAEITRLRAESVTAKAESFAASLIASRRAVPAEKPAIIAAFCQADADDHAVPTKVEFGKSADGTPLIGSRVDSLSALYAARSPHVLTEETLPDGMDGPAMAALFAEMNTARLGDGKPLTPELRAKYLNMTPLGQATLAADKSK